jgi:hypothetical protein
MILVLLSVICFSFFISYYFLTSKGNFYFKFNKSTIFLLSESRGILFCPPSFLSISCSPENHFGYSRNNYFFSKCYLQSSHRNRCFVFIALSIASAKVDQFSGSCSNSNHSWYGKPLSGVIWCDSKLIDTHICSLHSLQSTLDLFAYNVFPKSRYNV